MLYWFQAHYSVNSCICFNVPALLCLFIKYFYYRYTYMVAVMGNSLQKHTSFLFFVSFSENKDICLQRRLDLSSRLEVCKSDPNPIGFVRISERKFLYRIGLERLFSIGTVKIGCQLPSLK